MNLCWFSPLFSHSLRRQPLFEHIPRPPNNISGSGPRNYRRGSSVNSHVILAWQRVRLRTDNNTGPSRNPGCHGATPCAEKGDETMMADVLSE